jgi:FkbM family methyltransferase
LLPDDHLLPRYQEDHRTYDMMFDPIYRAVGAYAPERYFIDVGANVGDTAIVMRHNAANPILCVEGHSQFLFYLRENIEGLPDIKIAPAFIGASEVGGPLSFVSRGGTGKLVPASADDSTSALKTRSLQSILDDDGVLRSGVALFKTDTDGMDGFILQEFLKLEQAEAALFFECDVRQTILEERRHATWHSVFGALKERGYSLIIFDNFGYRMASCSPEHYDLVRELLAYVEAQFSHRSVHLHYLDIWAFPPAMATIFENLRADAFPPSPASVEPFRAHRQGSWPEAVFRPSSCVARLDQARALPAWNDDGTQGTGDDGWLEDWSYRRAQASDLHVDLLRARQTVQQQQRMIGLLSENLAQLRHDRGAGRRLAGFWRSPKK